MLLRQPRTTEELNRYIENALADDSELRATAVSGFQARLGGCISVEDSHFE
jgi:hypothetical protein